MEGISTSQRLSALCDWLQSTVGVIIQGCDPLPGDAGARHYYRVYTPTGTRIAVDAPPASENNAGFVALSRALREAGLQAPQVMAWDEARGFLWLSDLGDKLYFDAVKADPEAAETLYFKAIDALCELQTLRTVPQYHLPRFDSDYRAGELALFERWFLRDYLQMSLTAAQSALLARSYAWLAEHIDALPQVCMHRDYQSRNLLVLAQGQTPGVIDFQDAMWGPVTYDIVSLLCDCYLDMAEEQRQRYLDYFWQQRADHEELAPTMLSPTERHVGFALAGLQRHIKNCGIFARLYRRDGRPQYLPHLPRTIGYLRNFSAQFQELEAFSDFLSTVSLPDQAHPAASLSNEDGCG